MSDLLSQLPLGGEDATAEEYARVHPYMMSDTTPPPSSLSSSPSWWFIIVVVFLFIVLNLPFFTTSVELFRNHPYIVLAIKTVIFVVGVLLLKTNLTKKTVANKV